MEPLANRLRPKTFDEVVGQNRVIGLIKTMIQRDRLVSMILYGPTGVGKTTIAMLVADHYPLRHFKFNASTDSKQSLREIVEASKHYGNVLLIIDEIHRMNRDVQDYLLPYVETGVVTMLGLTTENPYVAVNPAVRSRVTIFRIEPLDEATIAKYLRNVPLPEIKRLEDDIFEYLARSANGEIRTAVNMLELLLIQTEDEPLVSLSRAKTIVGKPQLALDKNAGNYYDILSAFHKSVRGSDVNAALHYLARLIVAGDLESLLRRISAIVYEDIGLANPGMGPKVAAACDIARHIGFPEAINALGAITIEMCLSPKSNSAHLAVNKAIADIEEGKTYPVPTHLINNPTYDDKQPYVYAHDGPDHVVAQQYLPKELLHVRYYEPQTHTKMEAALKDQYDRVETILKALPHRSK